VRRDKVSIRGGTDFVTVNSRRQTDGK
jgi:hypothetical protein